MKFNPLATTVAEEILAGEYKSGREIGGMTLGNTCLFVKARLKVSYIPQLVQTKMCCGKGDLEIENIVICGPDEAEIAQIQLPGSRAGVIALEEIAKLGPHIKIGKPE